MNHVRRRRTARVAGLAGVAATLLLVAACGGEDTASSTTGEGSTGVLDYTGTDRHDMLVEKAREEGQVVMYSVWSEDLRAKPMIAAFQEEYPFIEVSFSQLQSSDINRRVTEEHQAGHDEVDLVESGFDTMAVLRAADLLARYDSPERAQIVESLRDPDGYFVADRQTPLIVAYNKDDVSSDDVPQTWDDLVSPEMKGKLSTIDTSQAVRFFGGMLQINGDDYADQLAAQDVTPYSISSDGLRNLLATGEAKIGFPISLGNVTSGIANGEPIAWTALDATPMEVGYLAAIKNGPHPHATALFMDWLLSEDGQTAMAATGEGSAREGMALPWEGAESITPYYTEREIGLDDYLAKYDEWQQAYSAVLRG